MTHNKGVACSEWDLVSTKPPCGRGVGSFVCSWTPTRCSSLHPSSLLPLWGPSSSPLPSAARPPPCPSPSPFPSHLRLTLSLLCSLLSSSFLSPWNYYHRIEAWRLFAENHYRRGESDISLRAWLEAFDKWSWSQGKQIVDGILKSHCGTRYLHGGTKYTHAEADKFHCETTKMKRQLRNRFQMNIPVRRDITVTNELVPKWSTSLLCFHRGKGD